MFGNAEPRQGDTRIKFLEAENERLRAALRKISNGCGNAPFVAAGALGEPVFAEHRQTQG